MTQRACMDCRHFRHVLEGYCCRVQRFSLVYGHTPTKAHLTRQPDADCGPDAKLFERRGNWLTRLFTDGEG